MKKVVCVLLFVILIFANIVALSSCSVCSNCKGAGVVTCDSCDGECFSIESIDFNGSAFEVMVACEKCNGIGEIECPECPGYIRIIETIKTKLSKIF